MYKVTRIDDGEISYFTMTVCDHRVIIEDSIYGMVSPIEITITKVGDDEFDNLVNHVDGVNTGWGAVTIVAPFGYEELCERIIEAMKSANLISDIIINVIGDAITDYFKGGDNR